MQNERNLCCVYLEIAGGNKENWCHCITCNLYPASLDNLKLKKFLGNHGAQVNGKGGKENVSLTKNISELIGEYYNSSISPCGVIQIWIPGGGLNRGGIYQREAYTQS